MPRRIIMNMKKWYTVGAIGTMLVAAACGPISARDAQGVLDTGREIQRLQQEEITPRLDAISALREQIDPLEVRLRKIEKEFRVVERESIRPIEDEFSESRFEGGHELMRELEEEFQARMRAIDDEQRELEQERREMEAAFQHEARAFDENFQSFENEKSDRMKEIDEELRELYRDGEDQVRDLYDDAEKIEKKLGRIDWNDPEDADKAKELEDELKEVHNQVRDVEEGNRGRIEHLEDQRFALEDDSWDQHDVTQSFFDELEERERDEFDAIEVRRFELENERWALDEEMRQKFEESEDMFREREKEAEEQLFTILDGQLGPLEEEALRLEDQLEDLYAREHALQRELATFSREIAPLRQNMESSMLDLLDSAIQAAEANGVVFADDAGD